MTRRLAAVAMLASLLLAPALARADDPPTAQQALLLLRILAYDRKLKARSGGKTVVVVVLSMPGDRTSEEAQAKIVRALEETAERTTVLGMPVEVVALPLDTRLDDRVAGARAAALYVCPGLEGSVETIAEVTRKRSVLSLSPRPEPARDGLAVGFAVRGKRTAVIVNLSAARAEGVDFESSFLRIAEVIKP